MKKLLLRVGLLGVIQGSFATEIIIENKTGWELDVVPVLSLGKPGSVMGTQSYGKVVSNIKNDFAKPYSSGVYKIVGLLTVQRKLSPNGRFVYVRKGSVDLSKASIGVTNTRAKLSLVGDAVFFYKNKNDSKPSDVSVLTEKSTEEVKKETKSGWVLVD